MFCYEYRGKSTRKRQQHCNENKRVEMRTTSTKRSWEMLPLDHTWRNSEAWNKTKTPGALANKDTSWWQSDAMRCLEQTTKDYTQRTTSNGIDTLGSHKKAHGVKWRHLRVVWAHKWRGVILHKVTLTTCGTKGLIEEVYTSHLRSSRIVRFQLPRTNHNEKLEG
jgi:hypothetical protein